MNAVYLAGSGLACSLGDDVAAALAALRRGGTPPTVVELAEGFAWPLHAMPREAGNWRERLTTTVRQVVAQTGVLPMPGTPLWVASSSLDVGHKEEDELVTGDVQALADAVARAINWQGPVFTVSTACTSSINAVLAAAGLIRSGEAQEALVLGIEFSNAFTLAGFGAMQLLSPDRALPFGLMRNGLVLGEAVAALYLSAAPARWRIAGGANVVDGADPTGAQAGAVVAACHQALRQSGIAPGDIDLIKPQAAGSPGNDAVEVQALKQVFGDELPALLPLKHWVGHQLGASGVAELILLIACLDAGIWPAPTHALDPALQIAPARQAPPRMRHLLLNTIGFGGGHAALVLEDQAPRPASPEVLALRIPDPRAVDAQSHVARRVTAEAPGVPGAGLEGVGGWRLAAHGVGLPPPDWRDALARRLGQRPRRLGLWAELALYGALQCLDAAGEEALPQGARLRVASLGGPQAATQAGVAQLRRRQLPLPFTFLQSQPSLMLAALARALAWQGDASFMSGRDAAALQRLALQGAGPQGLLLGWVEEGGDGRGAPRSEWWRWVRA